MIARKNVKSGVRKRPCPVHRLAVEASEIVAALNLIEQRQLDDKSLPRDHDNEGHLNDRLDAIQTQASFCVPQSHDGAAFLLAMAASHRDVIVGSTFASDHERDEWERRCTRLIDGAGKYLFQHSSREAVEEWADAARYFDTLGTLRGVRADAA